MQEDIWIECHNTDKQDSDNQCKCMEEVCLKDQWCNHLWWECNNLWWECNHLWWECNNQEWWCLDKCPEWCRLMECQGWCQEWCQEWCQVWCQECQWWEVVWWHHQQQLLQLHLVVILNSKWVLLLLIVLPIIECKCLVIILIQEQLLYVVINAREIFILNMKDVGIVHHANKTFVCSVDKVEPDELNPTVINND